MECPVSKEVQMKKVAKIVQDRNVEYWRKRNDELKIIDKGSDEIAKKLKTEYNDMDVDES
jgi:hypothetical protein